MPPSSELRNNTIVITGGLGFVGRHLITEIQKEKPDTKIIVWDRTMSNAPSGIEAQAIDITEPRSYEALLQAAQPNWVIHLAGLAPVGASWKDPERVHRVNCEATRQLLETMQRLSPTTKMLAISSADIYGRGSPTPLPELPLSEAYPHSPYARSKWAMEKMITESFNDRVIRVRPFPHIGPGQQRGFVVADFCSQIAAIESKQQEPIIRVGNLEAIRDFTDVRDVVRAYRLLLQLGKIGGVYYVATGTGRSIQQVLDQLLSLSSSGITIEPDPSRLRPADIPVLIGDAAKLRAATGWQPRISFDQTITDTLTFWRDQFKSQ